jgi:hypothetical protein
MSKPTPTMLAIKNAHPRDQYITFDEGPHIYTVHGEQGYTSVTTWNHHHFPVFDGSKIINNILQSPKMSDPNYKYYGMTREDIQSAWDKNRDAASGAGTQTHFNIECYYNEIPVNDESIEFQYFKRFLLDFPNLQAYRTEWCVYYEELKLSGSIDMVFENPDGTIQIYDWKRCREIAYENNFGKSALTQCISHLPDTNFWHYALQLNTYKTILEHKYGKKVTGLYLVCMHPDNTNKSYDRIEVPFLEKEMENLFDYRRRQLMTSCVM